MDLPAIVHSKKIHFVVLYKIDRKGNYYISDSGAGLLKYSKNTISLIFLTSMFSLISLLCC
ncbi:MAG: hypothetical protein JXR48_07500 [Candidatus Delongbacteria bacterium]|nr:hypothetical protein [Candidatus Delongbacteria bacterium]MBN2834796.1 hypothetical protein [Candidatus Delongbacteria bacterium]